MITVAGKFAIGLEVEGKRYQAFTLRAGVVSDTIAAIEQLGRDASPLELRYATLAIRMSIEGLSPAQITPEAVMGLYDRDAVILQEAADEVEKKLDALSGS